jgi:hypothetical protein
LEDSLLRPQLLFGDQALHELGSFFLVGLAPFVQQHLGDLGKIPLLVISYLLIALLRSARF